VETLEYSKILSQLLRNRRLIVDEVPPKAITTIDLITCVCVKCILFSNYKLICCLNRFFFYKNTLKCKFNATNQHYKHTCVYILTVCDTGPNIRSILLVILIPTTNSRNSRFRYRYSTFCHPKTYFAQVDFGRFWIT